MQFRLLVVLSIATTREHHELPPIIANFLHELSKRRCFAGMREFVQVIDPKYDAMANAEREVGWVIHMVWPSDECPATEFSPHVVPECTCLVSMLRTGYQHTT